MYSEVTRAWLIGLSLGLLMAMVGSSLNFKSVELKAPACENLEFVRYVGCPVNSSDNYYSVGWPQKAYCYNDGKDSCSPWGDFLYVERNTAKNQMLKDNFILIFLVSSLLGSLTAAVLLTKISLQNKNS